MPGPKPHSILRIGAAAAFALAIAIVSSARAQTITEPYPQRKSPQPSAAAKSLPMGREKSCAMYGAGFVRVPASDTCVKIGGFVEGSVGASRSR
jgi:hypothetical protein